MVGLHFHSFGLHCLSLWGGGISLWDRELWNSETPDADIHMCTHTLQPLGQQPRAMKRSIGRNTSVLWNLVLRIAKEAFNNSIHFKHHFISKVHKQDQYRSIRQSSNINNHSHQRTQNLVVTVYGYNLQIINKSIFSSFLCTVYWNLFFLIVENIFY